MADNTTTTQVPAGVNNFYSRALLERAVAAFVHMKWGQVRDIPRNNTATIKFRRYGNLSAATTALTEGVTPAGKQLSVTDVTAVVLQYGDYVTVTDVVNFSVEDPVLTEAADILGDQAGDTLDQLCRDVLAAGTTVQYAGGVGGRSSVASSNKISADEIKKMVRTLKGNNAKKITRMIEASTGYATSPVNAAFIGIVHPNTTYDLKGVTGWTSVEKYPNQSNVLPNEVGSVDEVRFIETTNAKVFTAAGSGSIDVYATLFLGANAYGISRISGEAMKNIVKPLGSAGSADPLDQRATSGWKATFVAKILNNSYMGRLEHAVSS